jgi:hypothetical protein
LIAAEANAKGPAATPGLFASGSGCSPLTLLRRGGIFGAEASKSRTDRYVTLHKLHFLQP